MVGPSRGTAPGKIAGGAPAASCNQVVLDEPEKFSLNGPLSQFASSPHGKRDFQKVDQSL